MSPFVCVLDGHIACHSENTSYWRDCKIYASYSYMDLILRFTAI